MRHYPPKAQMAAIDISDRMLAKARSRALREHVDADLARMDAQHLEFADDTFDAVIATCVFCSVPDPVAGLREVRRVLKPGGRALFLEHVRSGNPVTGKMMDLLNPIAVRLSGANINRAHCRERPRRGLQRRRGGEPHVRLIKTMTATKTTTALGAGSYGATDGDHPARTTAR